MSLRRRPVGGLVRRRVVPAAVVAGLLGLVIAGWGGGPVEPLASAPAPTGTPHPTSPPSEASMELSEEPSVLPTPEETAQLSPKPIGPEATIQPAPIPEGRIATRVVVQALGIDLPVTRQTTTYPACGVAMYLMELAQPGQGGVTYLYAHAQAGNFLALYQESLVNDGRRMLGMAVHVYTGDSLKFSYRIVEVRRHVTSLDGAFAWQGESVFLQTSEGPGAATPKLQVVATHEATEPADVDAAHPQPHPVVCR